MAYPRRDIAKTCDDIAVTNASQVLVPSNPSRMSLLLKNDSGAPVYFKLSTAVGVNPVATADTSSVELADGQSFATTDYTGPIAFITATTAAVTVLEI